jgi:glycosyltransferase involved in cell wall biosynthesis
MDHEGDDVIMKKKILVKAPAMSASGYGEQARFALRALKQADDKVDLFLINIPWGKTGNIVENEEEIRWLKSLVEKTTLHTSQSGGKPHFDYSLQITIPNEFEKIADSNVGYTAGIETTKVSPQWIQKSNMMDKIIVPSVHSKNVFEQTAYKVRNEKTGEEVDFKLKTPIEVCAFPAKKVDFKIPELAIDTDFNFLSVAQWGPRKNIEATITNFVKEFKNESNIGLVLKLNIAKNSTTDKEHTEIRLRKILSLLKEQLGDIKCKVYLLHGNMTTEEMNGLYHHPKIKGFITTTHGEGFGLPMFDAAIAGLPIIAPAWSSYVDFLYAPKKDKEGKVKNKPHFIKIDFDLRSVQKEAVWEGVIQADSQWCWVKEHSVRQGMRELIKNHQQHLSVAKKLSEHVVEQFNQQKQEEKFVNAFGLKAELEKIAKIEEDINSLLKNLM